LQNEGNRIKKGNAWIDKKKKKNKFIIWSVGQAGFGLHLQHTFILHLQHTFILHLQHKFILHAQHKFILH
jgi:hypothetical protein